MLAPLHLDKRRTQVRLDQGLAHVYVGRVSRAAACWTARRPWAIDVVLEQETSDWSDEDTQAQDTGLSSDYANENRTNLRVWNCSARSLAAFAGAAISMAR